jgi:type I restriction enzyme, S subunit
MRIEADCDVPKIRFKVPMAPWNERTLGIVCAIGDADHWMPETTSIGVPYVMTGDFCGINEIDFKNAKLISLADFEKLSKKIRPEFGDILFARYASIGSVRYVDTTRDFIASYSCAILKSNSSFNSEYLFFLIQTNKIQSLLKQSINTGSQGNIGIESLKNLVTHFPEKREQDKLAKFFSSTNKMIELQQRKHNKLLTLKKAMLQKMFPQAGATTPEIRFKGLSGDWVEKPLSDLTDVRDGTHASPTYVTKGYPLITSKNVSNGFINYDNVQYISESDFNEINKRSKVDVRDILIGMIGTIGNTALIRETPDFAIKNVALVKNVNKVDENYLYQYFQTQQFSMCLSESSEGGTQKFIALSKIRALQIGIPQKIEQQKVGIYFRKLDELISKHAIQLQKLKQIKSACLERMFV